MPLFSFLNKHIAGYVCASVWISACRLLEEKNGEGEREREEMEKRLEELEEKIKQLKRLQQAENEAKNKLRQETSRLTAENMVCVCAFFTTLTLCS